MRSNFLPTTIYWVLPSKKIPETPRDIALMKVRCPLPPIPSAPRQLSDNPIPGKGRVKAGFILDGSPKACNMKKSKTSET